jgi:hypothetical protein
MRWLTAAAEQSGERGERASGEGAGSGSAAGEAPWVDNVLRDTSLLPAHAYEPSL